MKRSIALAALAIASIAPLSTFANINLAPSRLGDEQFKPVKVGETEQEVRAQLGEPKSVQHQADGETLLVYNYVDTWGMRSRFDVTFDKDGHVEQTAELRTSF
jgi:outer membrane protein assembly factor BamE (lipoprotein component of BamABCDE complex)